MDMAFILTVGVLVIAAEYVYALTGWPAPGLVNK